MPDKMPVLGASTGKTRRGAMAAPTAAEVGGISPATRDGRSCDGTDDCGAVGGCASPSALFDEEDDEEYIAAFSSTGAAIVAAGSGVVAAAALKSAALKTPLRLSASNSS